MAEVTGLRNNCLPYPIYGVPFGVTFAIMDADGDFVSAAADLDSEISKNGDTYANCTNEAVEIATNSGTYYLLLTGAELTADVAMVIVKTSTSGAKTTPIILHPRKLVPLRSGTAQGGDAGYITLDSGAGAMNDMWNGVVCVATIDGNVEARIVDDYDGSNQRASVTPDWNVTPDSDDTFVLYLPEGMQFPWANLKAISDDTAAADNLESYTDGGDVIPANIKEIDDDANAAVRFERLMEAFNIGTVDDATFSPTTTQFETDLSGTVNQVLRNQAIKWGDGAANAGLTFFITDMEGTVTNANGKVKLTVQAMPFAPADGDAFIILGTRGS